jgi:hypothetical protein
MCYDMYIANVALQVLADISTWEEIELINDMIAKNNNPNRRHNAVSTQHNNNCNLKSFLPFIKSLLEDVQRFTENQQRILFR